MASPIKVDGVALPGDNMDPDAIEAAATGISTVGSNVSKQGGVLGKTWQGLSASYHAPEQEKLFNSITPATNEADFFHTDMTTTASALKTFAGEVRTIKAEVAKIKADAHTFLGTIHDGKVTVQNTSGYQPYGSGYQLSSSSEEDWDSDQGRVDTNNALIHRMNDQQEKLWTAERTCANSLNAISGAKAITAADPKTGKGGYGYTDLPDNAEMPWGHSVERKEGCAESVVKGVFVDGLWNGLVQGVTSLVGFSWSGPDGIGFHWDTFKNTWVGLAHLATAPGPVTMLLMPLLPKPVQDWENESNKTAVRFVAGLVGIDPYAKDPLAAWHKNGVRTAASSVFNIATFVVPETKVGNLGKAGDVGKVAEGAGKVGRVIEFTGEAGKWIKGVTLDGLSKITTKLDLGNVFKFGDDIKMPEVPRGETGTGHPNVGHGGSADAPPPRTHVDTGDGTGTHPGTHPSDTTPGTHPGDTTPGTHPGDTTPGTHPGDTTPGTHPGDTTPGTHPGDTTPVSHPAEHTPTNDPSLGKHTPEVKTQVDQIRHDIQPELQHQADAAWQHALARAKSEGISNPTPQRLGTYAHTYLSDWIKTNGHDLVDPSKGYRIRDEISFDRTGREVAPGTAGSIRPDIVIERLDKSGNYQVVEALDLKTGKAGIGSTWEGKVQKWLDPLYPSEELRPNKNPVPVGP